MVSFRRRAMTVQRASSGIPSVTEYGTDGLLLLWDGIENTQNGHDIAPTTIYDWSGNGRNLVTDNAEIGSNYFKPKRIMSANAAVTNTAYKHLEIVYDSFETSGSQVIHAAGNNSATIWVRKDGFFAPYGRTSAYNGVIVPIGDSEANAIRTSLSIQIGTNISTAYINGIAVEEFTTSTNNWSSNATTVKWFAYSGTNNLFARKVYAFRLYDHVLTEEEILHNWRLDKARFKL